MKFTRPFVFTLSTLALLISACNQALPGATPDALTPQFSTMAGDAADQLAVGEDGVYLGGTWSGKPSLIKFGRAGNIPWTRSVGGQVVEVALDSGGNAYVVFYSTADNAQHLIRKYTPSGTFVWQRQFTIPGADGSGYYASDMDAQNNVYLTFATSDKTELRKYSSNGTLLYSKQITGSVHDLAVAPDGTTYTVADQQRLTHYSSQGQQVWQKTLPFVVREVSLGTSSQVYVAGRSIFGATDENRIQLARYSSSGAKYWQRTVQQGFFAYFEGLDADLQGNVFVGVNYREDPRGDRDVYFHSYDAAGTRLAQRTFDFSYDDSLGEIGALSATEVYLGGTMFNDSTGQAEGFLTRLNGLTGSVTWQR